MLPDEKYAEPTAPCRKSSTFNGWFMSALAAGFAVGAWIFEKQSLDAECETVLQDYISGRETPDQALRKLGPDIADFYRIVIAEAKIERMKMYLLDRTAVFVPICFSAFFLVLGIIRWRAHSGVISMFLSIQGLL
jgi:hypothetical protein